MMSLTLTDIIAFYLIPLILAISVHEWAHAAVTTWLGDDTALVRGRVTLNPVSHSDPMWTVIIPTLGLYMGGFFIAAGKPVPYNPAGWRRTLWGRPLQRKWGEFLVAGAGPRLRTLFRPCWQPSCLQWWSRALGSGWSKPGKPVTVWCERGGAGDDQRAGAFHLYQRTARGV